jgi:hypothetical protein
MKHQTGRNNTMLVTEIGDGFVRFINYKTGPMDTANENHWTILVTRINKWLADGKWLAFYRIPDNQEKESICDNLTWSA